MSLFALKRSVFAIFLISACTSVFAADLIPDNDDIDEALISSIANNPRVSTNFFASTEAGLYQTNDGGKSWTPFADKSFGTLPIGRVVINPLAPENMIVKYDHYDYANHKTIIDYYTTEDSGAHWIKLNQIKKPDSLNSITIYDISFCPFHQNELIAGTFTEIYISKDKGQNWQRFNNAPQNVDDIYFSKTQPGLIYLMSMNQMYQSSNHGETWTKSAITQNLVLAKIVAESADPSVIYLADHYGVYRFDAKKQLIKTIYKIDSSPDVTDSERALDAPTSSLVALSDAYHTLILVADGKVHLSRDQGDHWQEIANTPFNIALSIKNYNAQGFFVYTTQGLFWGNADATEWYESVKGLKNIKVHTMAADENGTIYAGTSANLWRKGKNNHWETIPFFKDKSILHLSINKNKSGKHSILASTWFTLYLSEDDGLTWQKVLESQGMSNTVMRVNPYHPEQAIVTSGPRVALSNDGGKTWSDWYWSPSVFTFNDVDFNPFNSMEVTLISEGFAYVSRDGGKTWNKVYHNNPTNVQITGFRYDQTMVNHAYGLNYNYPYLYQTIDAGQNYSVMGTTALSDAMFLQKLIIDPANSATLYAVFSDSQYNAHVGGIYISKDKGINWELVNNDVPTQFAESALLLANQRLYVGTSLGVYKTV